MELLPGVHVVASGSGGFDLTDPFDCHAYLLDGGEGAALIDTGIGRDVEGLLAHVERAGIDRQRIRHVLITHAHPDHGGGAAAVSRVLGSARVLAHPDAARWIREGDEEAMSVERGKRAEFYPPDYRFERCPDVESLHDGEIVMVGRVAVRAIDTPGHSRGHLCFACEIGGRAVLFCGDLIFYGGLISLENNWDCRLDEYASSLEKLGHERVDALLPGHHLPSLTRGKRHIERANRLFRAGFVPPSVV